MKRIILILLIALFIPAAPQNLFQKFITRVNGISEPAAKVVAIDSFMLYARTVGIPFITGDSANFIYRGNVNAAAVSGDFNMWGSTGMTNLPQTNFWYYSRVFEPNARMDYKFITNGGNWILDPENPHTIPSGFGPNSELAMPMYVQPWEINYNSSIAHGTVVEKYIFSPTVGAGYQLKIYFPPGYDTLSPTRYATVYFQDGYEYVSLAMSVNVLDNLINANRIEKVIAVFVKPNNRNEEYAGSTRVKYRTFFATELVKLIDSTCKTINSPDSRLVLGDSYGGNISALISYNYPNVFGNCGLHSGAFQPNNYEIFAQVMNDLAHGIKKDIKWCSVWGNYEGELTGAMTAFADSLTKYGYSIRRLKLPEGHSWGLWRGNTDFILEHFFPGSAAGINNESNIVDNFILEQNYPNPFNPVTNISFNLTTAGLVTLKIYDLLGNEIETLVNEDKPVGNYTISFNAKALSSGVYFYKIQSGVFSETKKMVLMK